MTILFAKDWYDEKGRCHAIVHASTKNKSFIKMAMLLKRMDIKNSLFHLALYDPALLNIDPHQLGPQNDPTGELRIRVGVECKRNVWYYFREVIRIPISGGDAVQFRLDRGNLAMAWCYLANIDYNGTQLRQSGKTVCAISLTSWVIYISGVNMKIAMITHTDKLAQENVGRLKGIKGALPTYLIRNSSDDIDNKQGLDYKALNNAYMTYIGQKDKLAANRVGRGSSAPSLHFDEIAFIPNIGITFPAIMASTNRARINAMESGQMHTNLYTTTAGDPSTEDGKYAFDIISKAMPFTERLYDCRDKPAAHDMVAKNSVGNLVNGTFSYLQLGYSHQWFHDTINRNNVPPDEVERDYLNNWISLAKNPIISKDLLAKMTSYRMPDPMFNEVINDYVISWYVSRQIVESQAFKKKCLFLGCDSSEMIGKDFTTFVAVDPSDLSVVFTFRCNDSNTTKIGLLVARLLSEYARMLFIPERKSTGVSIIDAVVMAMRQNGFNPFMRIFNRIVDNYDQKDFQTYSIYDPSLFDTTARKYIGFMTTESTRETLYKHILQRAVQVAADRIYDPVLIMELSGLQAKNGRVDHGAGRHDDMCLAYLIACYVVFMGKNLHLYGISADEIMRSIDMTTGHKIDSAYLQAQMDLRKAIRDLQKQADASSNNYLKQHFLYKIRQLEEHLDQQISLDPVSIDSVRKDAAQYGDVYQLSGNLMKSKVKYSPTQIINALHSGALA